MNDRHPLEDELGPRLSHALHVVLDADHRADVDADVHDEAALVRPPRTRRLAIAAALVALAGSGALFAALGGRRTEDRSIAPAAPPPSDSRGPALTGPGQASVSVALTTSAPIGTAGSSPAVGSGAVMDVVTRDSNHPSLSTIDGMGPAELGDSVVRSCVGLSVPIDDGGEVRVCIVGPDVVSAFGAGEAVATSGAPLLVPVGAGGLQLTVNSTGVDLSSLTPLGAARPGSWALLVLPAPMQTIVQISGPTTRIDLRTANAAPGGPASTAAGSQPTVGS